MRRVRFSVAVSLDGYIAGPNGESDWIVMDPDMDFRALMGAFDTVLVGRKTYEATRHHGGGGMPGMQAYVFSRTLRQADCPGVIVSDKPAETLASLKALPGKDIWLFGGGSLFRSLLELGLVDAVEVAVIPVLLGGGLSLRPSPARQANAVVPEQWGGVSVTPPHTRLFGGPCSRARPWSMASAFEALTLRASQPAWVSVLSTSIRGSASHQPPFSA